MDDKTVIKTLEDMLKINQEFLLSKNSKRLEIGNALTHAIKVLKRIEVERIEKILFEKFGIDYLRDIHTGEPIDMTSEIQDRAQAIVTDLKEVE